MAYMPSFLPVYIGRVSLHSGNAVVKFEDKIVVPFTGMHNSDQAIGGRFTNNFTRIPATRNNENPKRARIRRVMA